MEAQAQVKRETVEDIILRHSKRGMHVLRKYMDTHYCQKAVEKLLSLPYGNILLTTGFYVEGHAETDGPLGTMTLGKALAKLGYHPIIVTDKYCKGFFEVEGLEVKYVHLGDGKEEYEKLLEECHPVALISI